MTVGFMGRRITGWACGPEHASEIVSRWERATALKCDTPEDPQVPTPETLTAAAAGLVTGRYVWGGGTKAKAPAVEPPVVESPARAVAIGARAVFGFMLGAALGAVARLIIAAAYAAGYLSGVDDRPAPTREAPSEAA